MKSRKMVLMNLLAGQEERSRRMDLWAHKGNVGWDELKEWH